MTFDPTNFGFKLIDGSWWGSLELFEFDHGQKTKSSPDHLRLNVYLSKDDDYVNIWTGLIDTQFIESKLEFYSETMNINFDEQYNQLKFDGYIQNNDEGEIILNAIRVKEYTPQILTSTKEHPLKCNRL